MAPDDAASALIVLRVVIRSPDVDTFVAKYSRFLKDDRIFIFTKASQPPGTRVRFTLELSDGPPLIHGEGTVTRIRPDSGDASKPPGMELRFVPIDEASRKMVERMRATRSTSGEHMPAPAQPTTNPGDDASTKIRTGAQSLPVHTPARVRRCLPFHRRCVTSRPRAGTTVSTPTSIPTPTRRRSVWCRRRSPPRRRRCPHRCRCRR
jgi:Tfp pilus assembly protein PilZ